MGTFLDCASSTTHADGPHRIAWWCGVAAEWGKPVLTAVHQRYTALEQVRARVG